MAGALAEAGGAADAVAVEVVGVLAEDGADELGDGGKVGAPGWLAVGGEQGAMDMVGFGLPAVAVAGTLLQLIEGYCPIMMRMSSAACQRLSSTPHPS
jgi:hypothetical protein